jgi:hypothetical protein
MVRTARSKSVPPKTGTIILAIRAVYELWCMRPGMGRRFKEGAVGSCLLPARYFAHKTRQSKAWNALVQTAPADRDRLAPRAQ